MPSRLLEGIATLIIVTGLLVASFQSPGQTAPKNPTIPPDTDGKVAVVEKCEPQGNPKWNNGTKVWVGRYLYKTTGNEVRGTIYLNRCRMDALGHSEEDRQTIIDHEFAHSRGWNHGEGTPETNPAYYAHYEFGNR